MQKKYIGLLVVIVFITANSAAAIPNVTPSVELNIKSQQSNSIEITLHSAPYQLQVNDDGTVDIAMVGFGTLLHPGTPMLPFKTVYVGLPPGATATSIDMLSETIETISAEYTPSLAPGLADSSFIKTITTPSVELEGMLYQTSYKYLGISHLRKYSLAPIQYTPISFDKSSGELLLHDDITLQITYEITEHLTDVQLADTAMDGEAAELIVNFDDIKHLYISETIQENRQNYDYFIITTAATATAINSFITWKTSIGYTVGTTTVSWITTHHPSGDTQQSIRNYLAANYQTWGTKYVLLVGSHSTIPMRTCWPDPNFHTADGQHDIPTDYYYADLTGNWDSDGATFYGEMGNDSVDFVPEVYVGRIPSDSSTTVTSITQKIMTFEQAAYSGWKKNAMLLGAVYSYANEDNQGGPRWDGADLMEQCKNNVLTGWNCYTMYEKSGNGPCSYPCSNPLANGPVITQWSGATGWGIVDWAAHGSQTSATRKVWSSDNGNGVPEGFEMTYPIMVQSSDAAGFNNNKPPVVFAASCYCAHPETSNNLGSALLIQGASAFVGATRVSWGSIGWTQPSHGGHGTICYDFNDRLANLGEECGPAMYNAKQYVFNTYPWGGWWDYANMYDFVLYGDPSMGMNLPPSIPGQPSSPLSGSTGMPLAYSTTTMDPTGDLIKYGWDWDGDFIVDQWDDNNGNYYPPNMPISTTHIWNAPGTYQVQVKAEDVYGSQSAFSLPLSVVITLGSVAPNQPQTPTGPTDGGAGVTYTYTTAAIDLNGDAIKYGWDWDGDGVVDQWTDYVSSSASGNVTHNWEPVGVYEVQVMAEDNVGDTSPFSPSLTVIIPHATNNPPSTPNIDGLSRITPDVVVNYTAVSTDSEGDDVYYNMDFGDLCPSVEWLGPFTSGVPQAFSHVYRERGTYTIRAQAKDIFEETSNWGTLEVTVPLPIAPDHRLLIWLIDCLSTLFKILMPLSV